MAIAEKETLVSNVEKTIFEKAYRLMLTARTLSDKYEDNAKLTAKYVHATSRGHEAVQLALGLQLLPQDFVAPYYRDDSILLGMGITPYELMLQLFAKKDDPFSGGRTYYCHPSLRRDDMPKIPHQSSATGMQAIPITGVAMGMQYKEILGIAENVGSDKPIAVCSIGDAATTEGEYSEAMQMAALKQFPILFFVQDNEWDISASADETRAQNAAEYAKGFNGIEVRSIDGSNFEECYSTLKEIIGIMRKERRPFLLHARVPLLGHHTSGVRREWYRDDLDEHKTRDPLPKLHQKMVDLGFAQKDLDQVQKEINELVDKEFEEAKSAPDPDPADLFDFDFAPSPITEEKGIREPAGKEATVMVDSALFAIQELMTEDKNCLLYGQDVGGRLGGVFREAATLAQKFGDDRVFNTPIQEAFIVGSTVGMSAVGLKPIVEVQFADYIWPGLNQLFTEVSRSYYLSNGKWPVSSILRVPIGAYGSGGPYHSSSVESILTSIRGIKVAYPSTGADLKGLMKAAYHDPNPVVMLEHKGLYWSKIKGTERAKTIEPDADYVIPFGKGRVVQEAEEGKNSCAIITYGMGVYWALEASKEYADQVEIIDLRTLYPLDEELVFETVKKHSKCLVVTEEPLKNSFAMSLVGAVQDECFEQLDAPVMAIGSENMPAIPLNSTLEFAMIPNAEKVKVKLQQLLDY